MKTVTEVTKEMEQEIVKHYRAQGVTKTSVAMVPDEFGATLEEAAPKFSGANWHIWKGGNGYNVHCTRCNHGQAYPDIKTREQARAIRFDHCGQSDSLPLLFRFAQIVKMFLDKYAPATAPQQAQF